MCDNAAFRGVWGHAPPEKILVCRSSEIDFDTIWANLGGKIANIFSTLVHTGMTASFGRKKFLPDEDDQNTIEKSHWRE